MVHKTSIEADKFPRMQRASLSSIFVVIPPVSKNNSGVNPNLKLQRKTEQWENQNVNSVCCWNLYSIQTLDPYNSWNLKLYFTVGCTNVKTQILVEKAVTWNHQTFREHELYMHLNGLFPIPRTKSLILLWNIWAMFTLITSATCTDLHTHFSGKPRRVFNFCSISDPSKNICKWSRWLRFEHPIAKNIYFQYINMVAAMTAGKYEQQ